MKQASLTVEQPAEVLEESDEIAPCIPMEVADTATGKLGILGHHPAVSELRRREERSQR